MAPKKQEVDDAEVQRREIERGLRLLRRQQAIQMSRTSFMSFVKFTSPDPADPDDTTKSTYENALHHDAVAAALEEVEKGNYQFLILTMPPRHGKSELVSRRFPAWFMGKHPDWSTVVATYNDDFAMDFGAEVRKIMASTQFKNVFPDTRLVRGGQSKDRLQTTQGGMSTFVGVGGSLTGRGAHCFPAGTLVETDQGTLPIEQLRGKVGQCKVLSFNKTTGALTYEDLQAFAARPKSRLYRITTAKGRVVEATGDHPFWSGGKYVEARSLAVGDPLLCVLPQGGSARVVNRDLRRAKGLHAGLLQQVLRVESQQRAEPAQGSREGVPVGAYQVPVVFDAVRCEMAREEPRVPGLLLEEVLGSGALSPHEWEEQSSLEGRRVGAQAEAQRQSVSCSTSGSSACRPEPMHHLHEEGVQAGGASHQPRPYGQPGPEFGDALLSVPSGAARCGGFVTEDDTVALVERVRGKPAPVFDIQVANNNNFFANGVGAKNCLIIDDLIKDYEQARSKAFRDRAWEWFTKVAMTRRMGPKLVIITFTRWHQDDIIGRLTDPENENYNRKMAEKIKIIELPALAGEEDPLGREPGQPLWPERYDEEFLDEQRTLDPLGFQALYQQRPSLMDGDLFTRDTLQFFDPAEIDERDLRIYCSSDHAVDTKQRSDYTCLLRAGVDKQLNIYLLDCWWQKKPTDIVVEQMLQLFRQQPAPLVWWAEKGHISKSIGPFLRKRMAETSTYGNLVEVTPAGDKVQRAQSIVGRAAMGKLFFPKGKPWVERAINEMMAFPNGLHDDFVDALAYIGLGLGSQIPVTSGSKAAKEPRYGTLAWLRAQHKGREPATTFGGF